MLSNNAAEMNTLGQLLVRRDTNAREGTIGTPNADHQAKGRNVHGNSVEDLRGQGRNLVVLDGTVFS